MLTLAVASQKGGSGKTTLSVHLAVAAVRAGERVLLLDADPQRSCLAWASLREDAVPIVEPIDAARLAERLERAKREHVTLCVVDTEPRAGASVARVLRAVDFVVVPVRPSAFDIATVPQSVALVTAAGKPGCIVLNSCPPRAPEIAEARLATESLELPLAPIEVAERRLYGRAIASGLAVGELDPGGPAATEMDALWTYAARRMR